MTNTEDVSTIYELMIDERSTDDGLATPLKAEIYELVIDERSTDDGLAVPPRPLQRWPWAVLALSIPLLVFSWLPINVLIVPAKDPPARGALLAEVRNRYQIRGELAELGDVNGDGVTDFVGVMPDGRLNGISGQAPHGSLWELVPTDNKGKFVWDSETVCDATPVVTELNAAGTQAVLVAYKEKGVLILTKETIIDHANKAVDLKQDWWIALSNVQADMAVSHQIQNRNQSIRLILVSTTNEVEDYRWLVGASTPRAVPKMPLGDYKLKDASASITTPPCVGDPDGDGRDEIIVRTDNGDVILFEYQSKTQRTLRSSEMSWLLKVLRPLYVTIDDRNHGTHLCAQFYFLRNPLFLRIPQILSPLLLLGGLALLGWKRRKRWT